MTLPRLRHFRQLEERVDTRGILAELERSPDAWYADTRREDHNRCQRDTRSICLRGARVLGRRA